MLEKLITVDKVLNPKSKILFVDDGSTDDTWNLINKNRSSNDFVTGIKFSKNFGHQNALIAGMESAVKYSDLVITIDADLQDDVNAIPAMVKKFNEGIDVVYGVRSSRETDTAFKRKTAHLFYWLMGILGVKLVPDSADYRLLSKRAVKSLLSFKERNLFLRGIVPVVGFSSGKVFYSRKDRYAGKSKYPLKKMIGFAFDGITSFSIAPIHFIFGLGMVLVIVAIILMIYTLIQKIIGNVATGWSSLMISIWMIGGVQLISISVLGEYIGKIFKEVKMRPRYIIEDDKSANESDKR